MGIRGLFTPLLVLASVVGASYASSLHEAEAAVITRRQMVSLPEGREYKPAVKEGKFPNRRLAYAFTALQAWKKAMSSDPYGVTDNWVGPNVCGYKGVFCEQALDDSSQTVVAGIDLNHADISGHIPPEVGLLADLALLHLNSNRFGGVIPGTFTNLRLLHELDISNNRFAGPFPAVLEKLPGLKYLDVRFNNFEGELPCSLFHKDLDALFLNNNKFTKIPDNFGESPVSVVVLAHNNIEGHIPRSTGNMSRTLNEIIFSHNKMSGAIPGEIGRLKELRVLDISSNSFTGNLPKSMRDLRSLEHFDISGNKLKGTIPSGICNLPNLKHFAFGHNSFRNTSEHCGPPEQKRDASRVSGKCSAESCKGAPRKTRPVAVPKTYPPAPTPAPAPAPVPTPTSSPPETDYLTPRGNCQGLSRLPLFRCAPN